ncbi:MAG: flagellar hook-associated protein FlgK [Hydrogenovibrio sp.]|uniref:flagellar hook-associated protein FlgK n=1 Tax=Hydrogenovibrio sp. TaxID=2065821 RepID=UPI0028709A03|nr:flagellar hook-associated protein FlgK [Hydrogenovibrio sp.]MDR9499356.1 flagellar hook-associated protein FlgK [Hydrogenovibrio sp.]
MADMLSIGANATNAFRRAIEVTSHNVSNMGTEGYSRQRAEFASNTPGVVGQGFMGAGVKVSNIERVYASYIQDQLVNTNTLKERYTEQLSLSKQIEGMVAGNDEGVQQSMQRLFDSFQNLSNNTTNATSRRQVIEEVGNMESMLSNLSNVLTETNKQVNNQIDDLSEEVNNRLMKINELNQQVSRAVKTGVQAPNDLLDQRDQAIKELSGYMDIKTFRQQDGRVDIHTGDGRYPLISDNTLTKVSSRYTEFPDESRKEIYLRLGNRDINISDTVKGGQLGGVLDFRKNMLDGAVNDLGMTLNGLVASSNWQHYQGYDANGNPGEDIFKNLEAQAMADRDNAKDGSRISVTFNPLESANPVKPPYSSAMPDTYSQKNDDFETAMSAVGQMKAKNYEIRVTQGGYTFHEHPSGEKITPQADPSTPGIFQIDGLQFDLSDHTAVEGDRFLVKPHQDILSQLERNINDSDKLATRGQAPIPSFLDLKDRLGLAPDEPIVAADHRDRLNQIFGINIPDDATFDADIDLNANGEMDEVEYAALIQGEAPSFPRLADYLDGGTVPIDGTAVDPDGVFPTVADKFNALFGTDVDGAGTTAFDALSSNGTEVTRQDYGEGIDQILVDAPSDYQATPKAAAEGDNTNIANLASFQSKKLLFSDEAGQATESLLGGYSAMSANVGMYVRGTEIQMDAQTSTYDQIMERRESVSGVNLDEEAANLMKFQQAYQASAQVIQTSQTLFNSLLGAVRL